MNGIINYIYYIITNANPSELLSFLGALIGAIVSLVTMVVTIAFTYKNTKHQLISSRETSLKANQYSEYLKDVKECVINLNKAYLLSINAKGVSDDLRSSFNPNLGHTFSTKNIQSDIKLLNNINDYHNKIIGLISAIRAYIQLMSISKEDKRYLNCLIKDIGDECNECGFFIRNKHVINFFRKYSSMDSRSFNREDPKIKSIFDIFSNISKCFNSLSNNIFKLNKNLIKIKNKHKVK